MNEKVEISMNNKRFEALCIDVIDVEESKCWDFYLGDKEYIVNVSYSTEEIKGAKIFSANTHNTLFYDGKTYPCYIMGVETIPDHNHLDIVNVELKLRLIKNESSIDFESIEEKEENISRFEILDLWEKHLISENIPYIVDRIRLPYYGGKKYEPIFVI